jgi:hypothetical protein
MFLSTVLFCATLARSAEQLTPDKVSEDFRMYLHSIHSVSFHSQFRDRQAEDRDFTNTLSQDWKVDFDGKRLWRTTNKPIAGVKPIPANGLAGLYSEQLMTPARVIEVEVDPITQRAQICTSYLATPQDYWAYRTGFLYLAYPFGYLEIGPGYDHVTNLLANASLEDDGKSLIVLSGKTPDYELRISLAPYKGWMPERMEYSRVAPTKDSDEITHSLYSVDKSSCVDGVWLPVSYHCKTEYAAGPHHLPPNLRVQMNRIIEVDSSDNKNGQGIAVINQPKRSLVAEVTLSDVNLNHVTDDDFCLQATVPNGLKVSMQDAQRGHFVWLDGKVYPLDEYGVERKAVP